MQRRLEVAQALIHRPRVLFLDEPTDAGLDPQSRAQVWQKLHELGLQDGVTVFLTTATTWRRPRTVTGSR